MPGRFRRRADDYHAASVPVEQAQATVLALWSFGMVLARSFARSPVSSLLAAGMQRSEQMGRGERLREWSDDVPRKRVASASTPRRDLLPGPPGLGRERGEGTQLATAIEATALGEWSWRRPSVWSMRLCAPGRLAALAREHEHAWHRQWLRLLRRPRPPSPDTGPLSSWPIAARMPRGGFDGWCAWAGTRRRAPRRVAASATGATCWRPLATLAPCPGTSWRGTGIACARNQVPCTSLARWEGGNKNPCLILTDLAPGRVTRRGTACALWIEQGSRITSVPLAVAPHPDERAVPGWGGCGWPLPWPRDGCPVSAGRPTRRFPPHAARRDGLVPGVPVDTAGDAPAAPERVS